MICMFLFITLMSTLHATLYLEYLSHHNISILQLELRSTSKKQSGNFLKMNCWQGPGLEKWKYFSQNISFLTIYKLEDCKIMTTHSISVSVTVTFAVTSDCLVSILHFKHLSLTALNWPGVWCWCLSDTIRQICSIVLRCAFLPVLQSQARMLSPESWRSSVWAAFPSDWRLATLFPQLRTPVIHRPHWAPQYPSSLVVHFSWLNPELKLNVVRSPPENRISFLFLLRTTVPLLMICVLRLRR